MKSRKAWRNREAGVNQAVLGLIEALRDGIGAQAVGLVDDDRSDPGRGPTPPNFWEALSDAECARIDWGAWYADLRATARAECACGCRSRHRLRGFLLHDRWALLVVASLGPQAGDAAAIASSLRALAESLPPGRKRDPASPASETREPDEPGGQDESPGARGSAPRWWVRRRPQ